MHEAWELLGYSNLSEWWEYLYYMAGFVQTVFEGCEYTYDEMSGSEVKALMLIFLNSEMTAPDPAFPRDFVYDGYAAILYRLYC